ncbi:MAG: DUF1080 domain-containing protein [Gemmataceae bacterium]|nr:DUF1080 domain-containing protein [Gemmataceae bacterium]
MRWLSYGVFVVGLAVSLPFVQAGEFKLEPGFTLIFNGKNLDGWQAKGKKDSSFEGKTDAFKGRFKVQAGSLVVDPAVKGDSYLETNKEFAKDVTIKFDFKAGAKCNNDIFLRGIKFDIVPGNKENKSVKEGEWASMEIVVTGDKVEHKVNGEVARTSKIKSTSSTFVIRAEFGAIEIKNIRVKS